MIPMVVQNNTISPNEEATIRNWVNKKYWGQSEAYKNAAYKDAYNAVLQRKADYQTKLANENKRKTNAEIASYNGKDKVMKEKAKLAKAELAISDAADLIREWQRSNWATVNNKLTDKQLVDSFLLANNWKPYAEYVSKYINDNMNWNTWTNNLWLASKLWLDTGTTMWIDNRTLVNAIDKGNAGLRGFGQWLVNLTQNTIWTFANAVGSNVWAWLWEIWYALANAFWADTSKWSVWDKLKKAEWYSWSQARDAANSKLWEWLLSEDQWAYNIWENLWELTSEIALTAPLELGVWSAIQAGKIGKTALDLSKAGKFGLQAANAWLAWAWFQLADDAAKWEMSSPEDYIVSSLVWAWTAWIGNALWKTAKIIKKSPKTLFWAKWQVEDAMLKLSPDEYARREAIIKWNNKNINAEVTPYTEIDNTMTEAKDLVYKERLNVWEELEKARDWLSYVWKSAKDWTRFDRAWVIDSINERLNSMSKKSVLGNKRKDPNLIPKFEIVDWKLTMSNAWIDELNKFSRNANWTTVKLWDEIQNAYNSVYGMWWLNNAANTDAFITSLNRIFRKWWSGWPTNMMRFVKQWIVDAENKFEKSVTEKSYKAVKEAKAADEKIINLDENFESMFKTSPDWVKNVWSAYKATKWWVTQEELFKKIKEVTKKQGKEIDLNNDILAWAKMVSLYDSKAAADLLNFFYPSKAWVIETGIKYITQPIQRWATKSQVKNWKKLENIVTNTKPSTNTIMNELGNVVNKGRKD